MFRRKNKEIEESKEIEENKEIEMEENTLQQLEPRQPKRTRNSEIAVFLYVFVGLFVICIVYLGYFVGIQSKDVINNPYNKRASVLQESIFRGSILSNDGTVLAYSSDNGDNTETRVYPYGKLFSHVVGRFTNTKTGIESSEEFTMLTSSVNLFEIMINQLSGTKSKGNNVVTTLDVDLQQVAYDALGSKQGAVVVMEPSTGKILAMVSKPDYDPNHVASQRDSLISNADGKSPLVNRATQGLYAPGSTFKMLTLLSYMRQNQAYDHFTFDCHGEETFTDENVIHCYNNKRHGEQTLKEAFANSCNTAFANVGLALNLEEYRKMCDDFLFNSSLPLEMAYNSSKFPMDANATEHEILQTVIGQGKTLVTPMHMAMITSAIANGGNMMTPYVVDEIQSYYGDTVEKNSPKIYKSIMTSQEAETLTEYMQEVVTHGTAGKLKNSSYSVAGKTGTAEVEGKKPNSWFVGFAPAEQPEIVVSVVVEDSGVGSDYAVPITKKILDQYRKKYHN